MFDADRPIVSSEQDQLGRSEFANYLARCMLDHKTPDSLVLGLQGGWGSGKTSLINLIIQELHQASKYSLDSEKPIILNFSPWSYSGQNQLIYGFFRRLSSELRRCTYLENADQIIYLLELYVSFFTQQPIPKPLKSKRSIFSKIKGLFTKTQNNYAFEAGYDPTQVKLELNELLKKLNHKIIIIIDNISRIEAKEILQIFQIVKSMGDYANTIYLLAYDKEQITRAIEQLHKGEGAHYLEKLVQLPFDVPPISKQDIDNLLIAKLQHIVQSIPPENWNNTYWSEVYYSSLKYFFNSSRDITRYLNTLSFSFLRVKELVNPVDFFALTALEEFERDVYIGIHENKDLFTNLLENVYVLDADKNKKDKLRCDEVLNRAKHIPIHVLQKLLMTIFPRLRSLYESDVNLSNNSMQTRKDKRVCSPDIFDIYFRLSIPTGYIADTELNTLLTQIDNKENFSQVLLRLNQDGRISKFLDLLDDIALQKIKKKNINNVIGALLDCGDLFPDDKSSLLHFNTSVRVHRICQQLLRSLPASERYAVLQTAINESNKSILVIINELMMLKEEEIENSESFLPLDQRTFTANQLIELEKIAVEKIKFWASIGRLIEHPKLLPILYAWKNWGQLLDCQQFITQTVKDQKGLLAYLGAALQVPVEYTIAHQEKSPEWKNYLTNITDFIPLETIEPLAKAIFESEDFEKLREKEQLAILIFLDLIGANTVKIMPNTI
ncbi:MAG: P-loop NTPase fold protein [Gammaproteobacteria bacterium]|nr:P-loop NTPase fold protein [Gammaproteobacteria bacterium]